MKDLKDKVVVITGAARGIGRQLAIAFAKENCNLALVDIYDVELLHLEVLLSKTSNIKITTHTLNVADLELMKELPELIFKEHGKISILINNAGISINQSFDLMSIENFRKLIEVNFWGTVYGCKLFIPFLKRNKQANLVNILSDFSIIGFPKKSAYSSSKFALLGFSHSLFTELYPTNIKMSIILLGWVNTKIASSGLSESEELKKKEIEFLKTNSLNIEKVAIKIVNAIKKDKYRVRVGLITYFLDWAMRFFPYLTMKILAMNKERIEF